MPRRIACSVCGVEVYIGPGSLGEGKTTCRSCRRARRPNPKPLEVRLCDKCGRRFEQRQRTQRYCSVKCRGKGTPRASTTARGYGGVHQAERRKWDPIVNQGQTYCAEIICLEHSRWIQPGTPWDLAHNRTTGGYLGPAHRKCNRAEGARYKQGQARPTFRRETL